MTDDKINISWDDLRTRKVDTRIREQDAMERNRNYAQMQEDALPSGSKPVSSIWNNAIFCMTVFGLIGGILAFGAGKVVTGPLTPTIGAFFHYQPRAQQDSRKLLLALQDVEAKQLLGQYTPVQAQLQVELLREDGHGNPYFQAATDSSLTEVQRLARIEKLKKSDRFAVFVINTISYGICGMMLALCLALAEPITQRKYRAALINGFTGAFIGLLGGIVAALLIDRISGYALSATEGQANWVKKLATQAVIWGTLGIFLGMASGLVLLNAKKFAVGLLGGLLGGLIGGVLYDPVHVLLHNKVAGGFHLESLARLLALCAIGVVAGLATGFLENAIKAGWLKVTSGIIAGKQFILYRNPTYIGSAPECQIYLFKDPQVGKRHAAIHLLPGGIEIENLPLGAATLINGRPIERARLQNGDEIQIGLTSFRFQEKRPVAGKG